MPKLPKNMVRRGKAYYLRKQTNRKEVWVPLGSDYRTASAKFRELRDSRAPLKSETVMAIAPRWLESYIGTRRTPENQKKAHQRLRDYVLPVLGSIPISRVRADDVRRLRLDLEAHDLSAQL